MPERGRGLFQALLNAAWPHIETGDLLPPGPLEYFTHRRFPRYDLLRPGPYHFVEEADLMECSAIRAEEVFHAEDELPYYERVLDLLTQSPIDCCRRRLARPNPAPGKDDQPSPATLHTSR